MLDNNNVAKSKKKRNRCSNTTICCQNNPRMNVRRRLGLIHNSSSSASNTSSSNSFCGSSNTSSNNDAIKNSSIRGGKIDADGSSTTAAKFDTLDTTIVPYYHTLLTSQYGYTWSDMRCCIGAGSYGKVFALTRPMSTAAPRPSRLSTTTESSATDDGDYPTQQPNNTNSLHERYTAKIVPIVLPSSYYQQVNDSNTTANNNNNNNNNNISDLASITASPPLIPNKAPRSLYKRLTREIAILQSLPAHNNILALEQAFAHQHSDDAFSACLITRRMDSDLAALLDSQETLSAEHIRYFVFQLIAGVEHMHRHGVLHRDLKPSNLLINADCHLRICDFGLARYYNVDNTIFANQSAVSAYSPNTAVGFMRSLLSTAKPKLNAASSSASSCCNAAASLNFTRHVCTRWYRAPEIILENPSIQTPAVDMWSVGCIFAQLLEMLPCSKIAPSQRRPLFAGKSCFPLSCSADNAYWQPTDQLNVIFSIIGTPSDTDIYCSIQSEASRAYLSGTMPKRIGSGLKRKFPYALPDAVELLQQMLTFNPKKRISATQALQHPYFSAHRGTDFWYPISSSTNQNNTNTTANNANNNIYNDKKSDRTTTTTTSTTTINNNNNTNSSSINSATRTNGKLYSDKAVSATAITTSTNTFTEQRGLRLESRWAAMTVEQFKAEILDLTEPFVLLHSEDFVTTPFSTNSSSSNSSSSGTKGKSSTNGNSKNVNSNNSSSNSNNSMHLGSPITGTDTVNK
jgi:serine/threonine protein kinase